MNFNKLKKLKKMSTKTKNAKKAPGILRRIIHVFDGTYRRKVNASIRATKRRDASMGRSSIPTGTRKKGRRQKP